MKTIYFFTAKWCGPCQGIKPTWYELESQLATKCHLEIIDIDEPKHKELVDEFGIQSIPTFIFIHNKKEVNRFSGANKQKLIEYVDKLLSL